MMPQAERNQVVAGVGKHGRAGVTYQCDARPFLDADHQFGSPGQLIVFMVADGRLADSIMLQQFGGLPSVLAGDNVHFAEQSQRADGDVLQVPDWRGNHIEGSEASTAVETGPAIGAHRGRQFTTHTRPFESATGERRTPRCAARLKWFRERPFAPAW